MQCSVCHYHTDDLYYYNEGYICGTCLRDPMLYAIDESGITKVKAPLWQRVLFWFIIAALYVVCGYFIYNNYIK